MLFFNFGKRKRNESSYFTRGERETFPIEKRSENSIPQLEREKV